MRWVSSLLLVGFAVKAAYVETRATLQCHSCSHTKNSEGKTDGTMGDPRCWEDPGKTGISQTCTNGDVCFTDFAVTWGPLGDQMYTITRGCAPLANGACVDNGDERGRIKQCFEYCNSRINCNDGLEILKKFSSPNNIKSCAACYYYEEGTSGNVNCLISPESLEPMECPIYANAGCYTSISGHNDNGQLRGDAQRGCSTFDLRNEACYETIANEYGICEFSVCKSVCSADDCNMEEKVVPEVQQGYPQCQVCSETIDQEGAMIGNGQKGCFDGSESYLESCKTTNSICIVENIADWTSKGNFLYRLNRRCASREAQSESQCNKFCSTVHIRDCIFVCDPKVDGDNCNAGNNGIDEITRQGRVTSCHTCHYYEQMDGTQLGTHDSCKKEINSTNNIPTKTCPPYADKACYDSAAYHQPFNPSLTELYEDFYRGCSPFLLTEHTWHYFWSNCENLEIQGVDLLSCKATCEGDNCNVNSHEGRQKCYTCRATRDGSGRPMGTTDDRCFDHVTDDMLADCDPDSTCYDEMVIDWSNRGQYLRSIERGCIKKSDDLQKECYFTKHPQRPTMYKRCVHYCEENQCNDDMQVGNQFSAGNNRALYCQQCGYMEKENGDRLGLESCMNAPSPNREVLCPVYADSGCYIATNMHIGTASELEQSYNEVERGCSTFGQKDNVPLGLSCYDSSLEVNDQYQNFAVCKELCEGNNCNNKLPTLPNESDSVWPSCVSCQVTYNAEYRVVGVGSGMDCRGEYDHHEHRYELTAAAKKKFAKRCPNAGDYCASDMTARWVARGMLEYTVTRGCTPVPAREKCLTGHSPLLQYRDCQTTCVPVDDGNGCNDNLDNIAKKMSEKKKVDHCVKCSYSQDINGIENGNETCTQTDGLNNYQFWCPSYAKASCATATSTHQKYGVDLDGSLIDVDIKEYFRHCSPFDNFSQTDCAFEEIQGLKHTNCKNTCYYNNCNNKKIQHGRQCFSCTGTRTAQGTHTGIGDDHCFDNINSNFLIDCPVEHNYCVDELTADWTPQGNQIHRITRSCAEKPEYGTCNSGDTGLMKYKDCRVSCDNENGPCNNGTEIYERMADLTVRACHSCYWNEHDDGTVEGNQLCDGGLPTNSSAECPEYATTGCFTGASIHFDYGKNFRQIYKGCSSFTTIDGEDEEMVVDVPDDSENIAQYSTTKTSCFDRNCNEKHREPISVSEDYTMCQVCYVTVDQRNQTVGYGDADCWGVSTHYQQDCGAGNFCATQMAIEWNPRGRHLYTITRGCSPIKPNEETPCVLTSSVSGSYKECAVTCDPKLDGNSCNKGIVEVATRFRAKNRINRCYHCEYFENWDGSVYGNHHCKHTQSTCSKSKYMTCPIYAESACTNSHSYHADYTSITGAVFQDDYRGCTPFHHHNGQHIGQHCETISINGLHHENCKELCFGSFCNSHTHGMANQCYACSVNYDAQGKMIGASDPDCMQELADGKHDDKIIDCARDQKHCLTTMQVDWWARGLLTITFDRRCAKDTMQNECFDFDGTTTNGASIKARTCSTACKTDNSTVYPCNDGLEPLEGFVPVGNAMKSCTSCYFIERDDGGIEGNINCATNAQNDMAKTCPKYQSSACFDASAKHVVDGIDKTENHKGCSTFVLDGVVRTDDLINDTLFSTVKQTCTNKDNCNQYMYEEP